MNGLGVAFIVVAIFLSGPSMGSVVSELRNIGKQLERIAIKLEKSL